MSEKSKRVSVPVAELAKAMKIKTIFGNIATIRLAHIQEICWYSTGYTRICTNYGEYVIRQSEDEFERMNQEMRAEI